MSTSNLKPSCCRECRLSFAIIIQKFGRHFLYDEDSLAPAKYCPYCGRLITQKEEQLCSTNSSPS